MSHKFKFAFLFCSFVFLGCSHLKSGDYVQDDSGAWVFVPQKRGLLSHLPLHSREKTGGESLVYTSGDFTWPVPHFRRISSRFGRRGQRHHDGIDITGKRDTEILAAESGTILYSGRKISGYGNMVIIDHGNNVKTVYAHNSKNLVSKGERVSSGQKVALMGRTGRATGIHLHFEIRVSGKAVDPMNYFQQQIHLAQK